MLKKWFLVLILAFVLAIALSIGVYFIYPGISQLKKINPGKTSFMEYREKEWESKGLNKKAQSIWVPLTRISPFVVKAVLIAEDDKFWDHEGFDFDAIQKAIEEDIKKKKFKIGGSTITQQLAKNLYLSPSKSPVRKIKEAILTWRIEQNLSKKRIIEIYLNVAEWGDGFFGIEMAARRYYGKSASALTAEEAARLAAVLPNPRKYNPTGSSSYVVNRSRKIYGIMIRRGIVIPEYEEIIKEPDEAAGAEVQKTEPQASPGVLKGNPDQNGAPLPEAKKAGDRIKQSEVFDKNEQ
jgi:monofunctional biosynthetic peptidoglycan transglycosylase